MPFHEKAVTLQHAKSYPNMRNLSLLLLLLTLSAISLADDKPTRGIGIYPGSPDECFAPTMVADTAYRNLALNRRAWHSSSHDYNLTAQLVTDGYSMAKMGYWLVKTSDGDLPKREREWTVDGNDFSRNTLMGPHAWVHYEWSHNTFFDSIVVVAQVVYDEKRATEGYSIRLSTDDDTQVIGSWKDEGWPGELMRYRMHSDPNKQTDATFLPARNFHIGVQLDRTVAGTVDDLMIHFDMEGAAYWNIIEVRAFLNGKRVDMLPSGTFSSAWMSDGGGEQWLTTDLGAKAEIHQIRADWLMAPSRWQVEVSDDNRTWSVIRQFVEDNNITHTGKRDCLCLEKSCVINFAEPVFGRYVRLLMTDDNCLGRYALSELKVMGRGGVKAQAHPREGWRTDGTYSLNGGEWRLRHERANYGGLMQQLSVADSREGREFGGIVATVPATVLTSYVNVEAIPNPNCDDDLMMISESFFRQPFIYRTEFEVPDELLAHRCVMLCLDGINWKAEIWLNGNYVGRMDGAFVRGRFDVSKYLRKGTNVLAVRIINNANFGAVKEKNEVNTDFNGGILGADNPTFHASIGWDWISTVRGRNMGIWSDVYLSANEGVTLSDPMLLSKVEEGGETEGLATMTAQVLATNHTENTQQMMLLGWVGDIRFEQQVVLDAHEERMVTFAPDDFPQLKNRQMHLWWPNGYGTPYLYKAGFQALTIDSLSSTGNNNPVVSSSINYQAGIREVTYRDTLTALKIYVNGRRFIPLGGNWGFPEHNLNYRGREYDVAVGYHRQMNFTMIRNWVGQTGDESFFDACDRQGIMVWQDFWLANPSDGPNPEDEQMFMDNASDFVGRIRHHPCLALYCGRNEGYPPPSLNSLLKQLVEEKHPGMGYIPSSADDGVGGHGPYNALPREEYFKRPMPKLHTERGMPNVMTYEGLCRTLRAEHLWPQNKVWGQHDFTQKGAQRGETFNALVERAFGQPSDARTFTEWAQWVNYDGYRAMFESNHLTRTGLIIWMSHPAFPSMVWQTYDYYFEPTAAFFACRKACEPLHVQWNPSTDSIELVNTRGGNHRKVRVRMEQYDLNGKLMKQKQRKSRSHEDSTLPIMQVKTPKKTTDVWFLRLTLLDEKKYTISENTYVCSHKEGNWKSLLSLPDAHLATTYQWEEQRCVVTLRNTSACPALMIRLNLKAQDGEQILPVSYSDNYFHMMPGEEKVVDVRWSNDDGRGMPLIISISGMNANVL